MNSVPKQLKLQLATESPQLFEHIHNNYAYARWPTNLLHDGHVTAREKLHLNSSNILNRNKAKLICYITIRN